MYGHEFDRGWCRSKCAEVVVVRGDGRAFEPGLATADFTRRGRGRGRWRGLVGRRGSWFGRDDGCEDQKTRSKPGSRVVTGEGNRGLRSAWLGQAERATRHGGPALEAPRTAESESQRWASSRDFSPNPSLIQAQTATCRWSTLLSQIMSCTVVCEYELHLLQDALRLDGRSAHSTLTSVAACDLSADLARARYRPLSTCLATPTGLAPACASSLVCTPSDIVHRHLPGIAPDDAPIFDPK
jgi:hypothetical protein